MTSRQDLISAIITAGATRCYAKVNNEYLYTSYDDEGHDPLEPKSISLFIEGGEPVEIARAIYFQKPMGIILNGDFSVDVEGNSVRWYNLDYTDYTEQKTKEKVTSRALEIDYLKRRLVELEKEDE